MAFLYKRTWIKRHLESGLQHVLLLMQIAFPSTYINTLMSKIIRYYIHVKIIVLTNDVICNINVRSEHETVVRRVCNGYWLVNLERSKLPPSPPPYTLLHFILLQNGSEAQWKHWQIDFNQVCNRRNSTCQMLFTVKNPLWSLFQSQLIRSLWCYRVLN